MGPVAADGLAGGHRQLAGGFAVRGGGGCQAHEERSADGGELIDAAQRDAPLRDVEGAEAGCGAVAVHTRRREAVRVGGTREAERVGGRSGKRQGAGAVLEQRARERCESAAEGEVARGVQDGGVGAGVDRDRLRGRGCRAGVGERAAAEHPFAGGQRGEAQGAAVGDGRAGIAARRRAERDGAVAVFDQAAAAADGGLELQRLAGAGAEGPAGRAEEHRAAEGVRGGDPQAAAVQRHAGRAERGDGRDLDGRGAAHRQRRGVGAVEGQQAAAVHRQGAGPRDLVGDRQGGVRRDRGERAGVQRERSGQRVCAARDGEGGVAGGGRERDGRAVERVAVGVVEEHAGDRHRAVDVHGGVGGQR